MMDYSITIFLIALIILSVIGFTFNLWISIRLSDKANRIGKLDDKSEDKS